MDELVTLEVTFKVRYTVHPDWYGTEDHEGIVEAESQFLQDEGPDMVSHADSQADSVALVSVTVVDTDNE